MSIYFYILGFLSIFALYDCACRMDKSIKAYLFLLSFFLFFLLASLRCGDQDYSNYYYIFLEVKSMRGLEPQEGTSLYYIEPGFRLLIKIISSIFDSPQSMFTIVAFISLLISFFIYKKLSPFIFLTLILYFVHTFLLREMLQIRAGIACSICLYSILYIYKKSFARFFICIFIASFFHSAAFVFVISYFFYVFNLSKKTLSLIFIIALLIGVFAPLGQFLGLIANDKILIYLASEDYNKPIGIFSNPTVLKSIGVVIIGLIFWEQMNKKYLYFKVLFVTYFLSVVWLLLFNDFSIVAARVATFFSITEVILLPSYLLLLKDNILNKFLGNVCIIGLAFVILLLNLQTNILPYVSILDF